ncbi:MAG: YsnF/AvaK domain-containing protein, partial [Chloroflexi bacterium]|nr:YsnF/AvaK domain-containing protein [Chloroflexota bacterium]
GYDQAPIEADDDQTLADERRTTTTTTTAADTARPVDRAPRDRDQAARNVEGQRRLLLREEELVPRTRTVQAGQVRLQTDVVSEQRTVEVPVSHEEVYVERHAVERRAAASPVGERSGAIAVPVHAEEVTIEKQPVVYEEVELGKRAVQERQVVSDTVRKEVVDIDAEGDVRTEVNGPEPQPRR